MRTKEMITVIMSLCILLLPQATGATPVPDTGQTDCFTSTSDEIITCPAPGEDFYGQDAQYNINTQSYTKLDENAQPLPDSAVSWVMVRDNMTGLIWESKDIRNGAPNYTNPHDPDNYYYWYDGDTGTPGNGTSTFDTQHFLNQLNAERYGGYDDWRLPTGNELAFIREHVIDLPGSWCHINKDYFPNTKLPEYNANYWTSSFAWHNTNQRIVVNFSWGKVWYDWTGNRRYVRAVRGETFTNDFMDNEDGTISDMSTGLMWLKDGSCLGQRNWQVALDTVYDLNVSPGSYTCDDYTATYDDWRLPNANELQSIVDYSTYNPTIDTNYFTHTWTNTPYWTSTTFSYPGYSNNYNSAFRILFEYGWSDYVGKNNPYLVRPVRGGTFLQFDVNGDDKTEGPVELLFCEGESKEISLWLTGWEPASRGDVESVDYYFTWDPDYLDVIDTPIHDEAWTGHTETKTPGQYHLQLSSTTGIPGQAMKLHTVTLQCTSSPAIAWMRVDITAGGSGNVTPVGGSAYSYVNPSEATINTICTGSPLTCTEQDHCETLDGDDICPATATQTEEGYSWEPQDIPPLCEGNNIIVSRTRRGYHTVTESSTPTVCDSGCFRECYDNCGYVESQGCYLRCIKGCANGVCPNWAEPEICYEYQNRIDCNVSCYFQCKNTYDEQTQTSYYDKLCGFFINEPITVRDSNGSCTGTQRGDPYALRGSGTASINVALPLQAGIYDVCAGSTPIGDPVTVDACGGTELCSLALPTNALLVDQGANKDLNVTLSNVSAGGTYALTLERWEDDAHTISLNIPSSLHFPDPAEATVAVDASVSFDLSAVSAGTEGGRGHWANVIVKAHSASCTCEAAFDLDIRNISAKESCAGNDYFVPGGTVYGKALLGLAPDTIYPLYIVDSKTDWTNGMAIPTSCTLCTTSPASTVTTDAAGEMACGTVLWANAQADTLPASFDIVIDVNDNEIYDVDTDFLDAGTIAGFIVDADTDGDGVPNAGDNCWEIANANQFDSNENCPDPPYSANPWCGDVCEDMGPDGDEDGVPDIRDNCPDISNDDQDDTYPSQGNSIGDACDCEADFNCDGNVDGGDVGDFLEHFGRSTYFNPCSNQDQCFGDFNCDVNVDGGDVGIFIEDFGRSQYFNPCPACVEGDWCVYP